MTRQRLQKVLVVDDDLSILHALSARLKYLGMEVAAKPDAMEALGEAQDNKPDIAIIDVNLPGASGFDLARKLDDMCADGQKVKKIFLTASKNPEFKAEAARLDAVGFLEKPYSPNELISALEACI
jgi:response regulator NasT